MKRSIAFFDFDGTITRKDTMLELVRFIYGSSRLYIGMAKIFPTLLGLKLGFVSAHKAKEKFLSEFFNGMPAGTFNEHAKKFSSSILPGLIRPSAMREIEKHKKDGNTIAVVSASAENWVKDFCDDNGISCIATKLKLDDQNRLTGKLVGANCNGLEKVRRIKCEFDPADYETIYAYGDSSGDKEMLSIATHPHFRLFTD